MQLIIWTSVYFLLIYFLLYYSQFKENRLENKGNIKRSAFILLGCGLIFRLIIVSFFKEGFGSDEVCWFYWAKDIQANGISNIYLDPQYFCDYPPGYLYVLNIIGFFLNKFPDVFAFGNYARALLTRGPAIICDLLLAYTLIMFAKDKIGNKKALFLGFFYLFSPFVFLNSSIWGQIDSVWSFFLIMALIKGYEKKLIPSVILLGISTLLKPQALLFMPIFAIMYFGDKKTWWKNYLKALGIGAAMFVIASIPFIYKAGFDFNIVIQKYFGTMGSYKYPSVNAYNLYAMLGANYGNLESPFFFLKFDVWGKIGIVLSVLLGAYFYFKNKNQDRMFFSSFVLMTVMFFFATMMHERYLYPAIVLMFFCYAFFKDGRFLHASVFLGIFHFINTGLIYMDVGRQIPFTSNADTKTIIVFFVSLFGLIVAIYALNRGAKLIRQGYPLEIEQPAKVPVKVKNNKKKAKAVDKRIRISSWIKLPKMGKWDYIVMSGITIIYAVVAFTNLGSTTAAQNFYTAKAQEEVILDLGSQKSIASLSVYPEIEMGMYQVFASSSLDDNSWRQLTTINDTANNLNKLSVFEWKKIDINTLAQYIKLVPQTEGSKMIEVALYDKEFNQIPVSRVISDNPTAQNLVDEQQYAQPEKYYKTSTYFDEIYHARTAYEYLHQYSPYENTHPPLGKDIIAFGIKLFGMTPFGWRVMGVLFGIFMVPLIYLLGKKMFKKTLFAGSVATLFAFDFMHYAQTRISTIDSYSVFFIIAMYLFMYWYFTMNFNVTPFKKTLVPLALCGIMFGIGAACKWTSIYAGLGLFILFVISFVKRYMEYKYALKNPNVEFEGVKCSEISKEYRGRAIKTILWCVLFFIIIPALIYMGSYFLFVQCEGQQFSTIFKNQKDMFDYHSKLTATHSYSSQWWQWIVMSKPLVFTRETLAAMNNMTSSITTMGNPMVWWGGIVAMAFVVYYTIRDRDKTGLFIIIGYVSQILPQMGLSRVLFIYHYFACVPFLVLAIVYIMKKLYDKDKRWRYGIYGYLALSVFMFCMFYPVITGTPVDPTYVNTYLKWMPKWYF